jgi:PIN domain nuclease of toxin-antitoxin system
MNKVVLDASAILAQRRARREKITPELLSRATASAVNLAEVQTILVREGGDPDESWAVAVDPLPDIELFTAEQARIARSLIQNRGIHRTGGFGICLEQALEGLSHPRYRRMTVAGCIAGHGAGSRKMGLPGRAARSAARPSQGGGP